VYAPPERKKKKKGKNDVMIKKMLELSS
jgi:hypothetical protein